MRTQGCKRAMWLALILPATLSPCYAAGADARARCEEEAAASGLEGQAAYQEYVNQCMNDWMPVEVPDVEAQDPARDEVPDADPDRGDGALDPDTYPEAYPDEPGDTGQTDEPQ
jgi:hypothetical protein